MDVQISIETTFENGEKRTHRLGCISRPFKLTRPEGFGLLLEDAKAILGQLEKAILHDQIAEIWVRRHIGTKPDMALALRY